MKRIVLGWLTAMLMLPAVVASADTALIFTNSEYKNYPRNPGSEALVNLADDFQAAGFEVAVMRDFTGNQVARQASEIDRLLRKEGRLVVILNGYIARTRTSSVLLGIDADRPKRLMLDRAGLSIDAILEYASRKQGDVVIVVGTDAADAEGTNLGPGLARGFRFAEIPQGVTVLSGFPSNLVPFIGKELLQPGRRLIAALSDAGDKVKGSGYVPRSAAFIPEDAGGVTPLQDNSAQDERNYWDQTRANNTAAGYREYLRLYPGGRFVAEAQRRLDALVITPQERAKQVEEALGLSAAQRRAIQRGLTLIGFDTRGVDGVFGPRTRTAIAEFQRTNGLRATGYLNGNQISRIQNQAERRAAQLRAEAEERRRAQERQDRQYWNQTGASGFEADLRTYLRRYPDGLFSDQARNQLRAIERQNRRLARIEERNAWNGAAMQNTVQAYRRYLRDYPNGRFVDEARTRIAILTQPETPADVVEAARLEESRLGLDQVRRQMIERRLDTLELQPGRIDGVFNRDTRRALRRFQRANQLPVTGYVTRNTIVRLLASFMEQ